MILFEILENEDSYKDFIELIISKVNFYFSYCTFLFSSNPVLSSKILQIDNVALILK